MGDDSRAAADAWYPLYAAVMTRIGRERGWPPSTRAQFEASRGPRGALLVGDPEEVAARIIAQHAHFRHDRFLLQMGVGLVPHAGIMRAIELLDTRVAPLVRAELG